MNLKKKLSKSINMLLKLTNYKIVKDNKDNFLMFDAVRRIKSHKIIINSVIDIGASDGKWSNQTIEIFPDTICLAIEPLAERKKDLDNLKSKHKNFDYSLCVAGENNDCHAELNVSEDLDGSTINGVDGEKRKVPIRSIDSLVLEKKLKGPFLLKFDTHGYEIPILKGASKTLSETNVIIMEVYNFDITDHSLRFPAMCEYMEKLGFRCYDMVNPMLRIYDHALWQMDLFFTRDDSNIFSYNQYK
jgi:FkbM family methyltransferase